MQLRFDFFSVAVVITMLTLVGLTAPARAQLADPFGSSASEATSTKPWAKGVSEANKATAIALFKKGNEFFGRSQFPQALAEYRQAIKSWNHPAIRYNMAVCLINLEEHLEAYGHLLEGLKYEQERPISKQLYADGQTLLSVLKKSVSWVTISVKEPGAKVSLDGKELFVGPGESKQLLLPGKHQVLSSKANMLTETKNLVLVGGKHTQVKLTMRPLSDGVVLKRRWKTWKPWAVAGVGLGLVAIGGLVDLLAKTDYDAFDSKVAEECPTGCPTSTLSDEAKSLESRALIESPLSISLIVAGGALVVGTGVLLFLNRERAVTLENAPPREPERSPLTIVPIVAPNTVGFSSVYRF